MVADIDGRRDSKPIYGMVMVESRGLSEMGDKVTSIFFIKFTKSFFWRDILNPFPPLGQFFLMMFTQPNHFNGIFWIPLAFSL